MFLRPFLSWRTLAAGSLALVTFAGHASAEMRIAVVDQQRAISSTEEGLRTQATLKKIFDAKQRELSEKQQQLEAENAEIEKQRAVISQDAFQRRMEALQQEALEFQKASALANQEIQAKQAELLGPLQRGIERVINRLATQEGYDLVIERQMAPYVRGDLDVTDRVIMMYNSGAAAAPASPAAGAPPSAPAASAPGAAPKATLTPPAAPAAAPAKH